MSHDWTQIGTFFVLTATLAVAIWYAWEARKQAEAQLKPCLTPITQARNPEDAVLEMGGIQGQEALAFRDGNVAIRNIGGGPAIRVSYAIKPVDPPPNSNRLRCKAYVHAVAAGNETILPIPRGALQLYRFTLQLKYESLSGQKYCTVAHLHDLVLTGFEFSSRSRFRLTRILD